MGRFRGGLRCIKYLLLGFNLLFWVRPEPAGQLGGRGPQGGDRNRVGPWGEAGCSRGARQTKREGTGGGGKGREKLEPPEPVRREDTVPCFPERSHHPRWHRPAGGARCGGPSWPPHSEGWGPRRPAFPAACCAHTPPSRAAISGEPGSRARELGGKALPCGCLGWRPIPGVCEHTAWLWWFAGKIRAVAKIKGVGGGSSFSWAVGEGTAGWAVVGAVV